MDIKDIQGTGRDRLQEQEMQDGMQGDMQQEKHEGTRQGTEEGTQQGMQAEMMQTVTVNKEFSELSRKYEWICTIGDQFSFYGGICLLYGIFYSFCLYKNPSGIFVPVFTVLSYGIALVLLRRMGAAVKKGSYFLMGISILISISTCRTGSFFLIFFNNLGIILLWLLFWLHQFYEDRFWNIGKYFIAVIELILRSIGMILYPFQHFSRYLKSLKHGRGRSVLMVLLGLVVAVPLVSVLTVLLSEADMVFQNFLMSWLKYLMPWSIVSVVLMTLVGMVALYCLLCEIHTKEIKEEVVDQRRQEPMLAITVMGLVGLLYVIFCSVQIVFLFLGRGILPEGVTFSEYAKEGFYQLVFVAVVNLVMVLLCVKFFKENKILKGLLTVISICTYVMIASAGYRMVMYVQEYHLTLLRILVLWFLGMLMILMVGVIVSIYKSVFPLFGYGIVVVSVCYMGLAWMRPDAVIASYNISHETQHDEDDIYYLTNLSVDAAPFVEKWILNTDEYDYIGTRYYSRPIKKMSFRTYNFSYAKANKCLAKTNIANE